MSVKFRTARADGRSDARVLADLVLGSEPGKVFTFGELAAALSAGNSRVFDRRAVQAAVSRSMPFILKATERTLQSIRNVGYGVSRGTDHRGLALCRKQRSDVQLKRGLLTLRHVKWDEMDAQAREAHQGTLMVMSAVVENQRAMESRLSKVEAAIRRVIGQSKPPDKDGKATG